MASKALTFSDEYLTVDIAAKRLGLRRRRFNEIAAAGGIPRCRQVDPKTQRPVWMYRASDVAKVAQRRTSIPAPPELPAVRPTPVRPVPLLAPDPATVPWLTIAEASAVSGLPESVLVRLVEEKRLAAIDCGKRAGGRYRVLRADLDSRKLCGPDTIPS